MPPHEPIAEHILNPVVQAGFAGFSVLLLSIIVWMIKRFIAVLRETHKVISANTTALEMVNGTVERHDRAAGERAKETSEAFYKLRDTVLASIAKQGA